MPAMSGLYRAKLIFPDSVSCGLLLVGVASDPTIVGCGHSIFVTEVIPPVGECISERVVVSAIYVTEVVEELIYTSTSIISWVFGLMGWQTAQTIIAPPVDVATLEMRMEEDFHTIGPT